MVEATFSKNENWQPGAKLNTIRTEAGVSLDVIAKETLIPFAKLQLLEEDNYQKIGTETFVIAYIRKYAKSLGISSDPFVEQYKFITGSRLGDDMEASLPTPSENLKEMLLAMLNKLKAWQIIGGLVGIWLLTSILVGDDDAIVEPVADAYDELSDAQALTSTVDAANTQESTSDTPVPVAESTPKDTTAKMDNTVNKLEADTAVDPVQTQSQAISAVDALADDILVLSFYDECWVEVSDAKGEVIFAQLKNSGDNLRLSGQAPFSVMLGNARAVDMLVNGRRISTEPPEGKRTRRVTAGP